MKKMRLNLGEASLKPNSRKCEKKQREQTIEVIKMVNTVPQSKILNWGRPF